VSEPRERANKSSRPAKAPQKKAAKAPQKKAARLVREQIARERRRRRTIWISVSAAAVLVLAGLIGWNVYESEQRKQQIPFAVPRNASADLSGVTVPGGRVTVDVYLDYLCPHCKALEQEAGETLNRLVSEQKATIVYHPLAFLDPASTNEYSTRSAASSGCAADQDKFVDYSNALFARQPAEGGPGLTDDELIQVAGTLGIVDPAFAQCVRGGRYRPWVNEVNTKASQRGVTGTPTVLVAGKQVQASSAAITAAVDAAPK
jgi:protein-disulfide isomerase